MVFSSLVFLFIFLAVTLALYFLMPSIRAKNIVLTLMSLVFYAWGEPVWVLLLLGCAAVGYFCGRIIGARPGTGLAKAALIFSLVISLGVLAAFKYLNFFLENINGLFGLSIPLSKLSMPIGISFFTFQTLSYVIDVYRRKVRTQRSFLDFLLFVSLFPQLIAGPILRYSEIEPQLRNRKSTLEGAAIGVTRFVCGLAKKVLISNYCSSAVDRIFGGSLANVSTVGAWVGMLLYAFHIYFDFSGYSDMAIGLGRIFGFTYSENFDHPYVARSITDFWRRWHISLGSWFRDYVYIPLGGNRKGLPRQLFNMLVVWALTGLWHGASWNFVLWGLWFFLFLTIEKLIGRERMARIPYAVGLPLTFLLVCIGWVFFRFTSLSDVGSVLQAMFGLGGHALIDPEATLTLQNSLPLLLCCIIGATPILAAVGRAIQYNMQNGLIRPALYGIPTAIYNVLLLALCIVSLIGSTNNPFIYFRF